jgi:hypothetical protein
MKKAMRILVVMAMMLGLGLGMGCRTMSNSEGKRDISGTYPKMGDRIHVHCVVTYGDRYENEMDVNQFVVWSGWDGDKQLPPQSFTSHGYRVISDDREDLSGMYVVLLCGLERVLN